MLPFSPSAVSLVTLILPAIGSLRMSNETVFKQRKLKYVSDHKVTPDPKGHLSLHVGTLASSHCYKTWVLHSKYVIMLTSLRVQPRNVIDRAAGGFLLALAGPELKVPVSLGHVSSLAVTNKMTMQ